MLDKNMILKFDKLMGKRNFSVNDVEEITGKDDDGYRAALQLTNAAKARQRIVFNRSKKMFETVSPK